MFHSRRDLFRPSPLNSVNKHPVCPSLPVRPPSSHADHACLWFAQRFSAPLPGVRVALTSGEKTEGIESVYLYGILYLVNIYESNV